MSASTTHERRSTVPELRRGAPDRSQQPRASEEAPPGANTDPTSPRPELPQATVPSQGDPVHHAIVRAQRNDTTGARAHASRALHTVNRSRRAPNTAAEHTTAGNPATPSARPRSVNGRGPLRRWGAVQDATHGCGAPRSTVLDHRVATHVQADRCWQSRHRPTDAANRHRGGAFLKVHERERQRKRRPVNPATKLETAAENPATRTPYASIMWPVLQARQAHNADARQPRDDAGPTLPERRPRSRRSAHRPARTSTTTGRSTRKRPVPRAEVPIADSVHAVDGSPANLVTTRYVEHQTTARIEPGLSTQTTADRVPTRTATRPRSTGPTSCPQRPVRVWPNGTNS